MLHINVMIRLTSEETPVGDLQRNKQFPTQVEVLNAAQVAAMRCGAEEAKITISFLFFRSNENIRM